MQAAKGSVKRTVLHLTLFFTVVVRSNCIAGDCPADRVTSIRGPIDGIVGLFCTSGRRILPS